MNVHTTRLKVRAALIILNSINVATNWLLESGWFPTAINVNGTCIYLWFSLKPNDASPVRAA